MVASSTTMPKIVRANLLSHLDQQASYELGHLSGWRDIHSLGPNLVSVKITEICELCAFA